MNCDFAGPILQDQKVLSVLLQVHCIYIYRLHVRCLNWVDFLPVEPSVHARVAYWEYATKDTHFSNYNTPLNANLAETFGPEKCVVIALDTVPACVARHCANNIEEPFLRRSHPIPSHSPY